MYSVPGTPTCFDTIEGEVILPGDQGPATNPFPKSIEAGIVRSLRINQIAATYILCERQSSPMIRSLIPVPFRFPRGGACLLLGAMMVLTFTAAAQDKPKTEPDVLVLSNGDTLHGTLVSSAGGKVNFHSEPLGDIAVDWDKVKELHTEGKFAVLDKTVKLRGKKNMKDVPIGTLEVADKAVTVHTGGTPPPAPIPVDNAQYIVDQPTLDKQVYHLPSFFSGWNGGANAGATLVGGTQNQYGFSAGLGMVRVIPTMTWLDPRNRTSFNISDSYGKITEPGFLSGDVLVPENEIKSAIFHGDFERDQYFSPRVYVLGNMAFDHNFSQNLQLQQIYGGGLGWTAFKTPTQELDLKGTLQYERQSFITGISTTNPNLIGSTFGASYLLQMKFLTFTQQLQYIPAYNDVAAYSANEANTVTFPAYKNLGLSFGTLDSYLNNPPVSSPPTQRNSFQFTMGLTYAIKSKY
jgi:hypothetical protein